MGWVTVSLRKMTLKNRINNLETDLIRISQQLQTTANNGAYEQQNDQLEYNYNLSIMNDDYMKRIDSIQRRTSGSSTNPNGVSAGSYSGSYAGSSSSSTIDNSVFALDMWRANAEYNQKRQNAESIFNAKNNARQAKVDAESNGLEAQKEQIEAQLKAARAEYESLGQAMDQDIKDGAIHLV